jgi:PKD repeat protein
VASAGYPVDLQAGPGGDLFYVDFTRGTIRRISYSSGNTPPVASISALPTSGLAPLAVRFDGAGSTDAEDGGVRFDWDLDGNGQFGDSAVVNPSYTYTSAGARTIRLRVTDTGGLSHTASIRIAVGNTAPTAVMQMPASTLRWRVGQAIAFSGSASDPQQGTLPTASLTWGLVMHHCARPDSCHEHPIQSMTGSGGSFVAPDHEYPSYLTLRLTARDSGGLEHAVVRRLDPQTVDLRLESVPTGLELGFGSGTLTSPAVRTVIVGSAISISAPSPQMRDGQTYLFSSWSHGGAPNQIVTAPPTPATFTASFVPSANPLPPGWSTFRVGGSGNTGTATHASGRFEVAAYGQDVWGTSDGFQFVHRSLSGDGEVVARVSALSLPAGASFALAGVMFRESMAANSRHAAVLIGSNGKLKFRRRVTTGGTTLSDGPSEGSLSTPYWVRLVRTGNVFRAYRSPDGRTWTETGPPTTIALPATVQVGLVALRSGASTATRASFEGVDISGAGFTGADIGVVGSPGSHARDGGTLVLRGGGTDVWAAADALHYVHRPWSGDGEITVRLRSLQSPAGSTWAMAGVMFRESLAAGARHASLLISTDGKLKFRRRGATAGPTSSDGPSAGSTTLPRWLRLTRRGNTFTASHSPDGITWTPVHTPQVVSLPASVLVGAWTLRNGGTGLAQAALSSLIIAPPQ